VLAVGVPDPTPFLTTFRDGLQVQGYKDGENIAIVIMEAEGDASRLPEFAADLVRQRVDVIIGFQTPTVAAAKGATSEIPIVMDAGAPVEMGLVASLARPGGNITGMSAATAEIAPKNLELLKDILPAFKRFSLFVNATDPFRRPLLEWTQRGAGQLGLEMSVAAVNGVDELAGAFEDVVGKVDAVLIQPSLPVHRAAELALAHHLPSASPTRGFVKAGGLLSYCANYSEIWHEMAIYVGKILKGAKPADLPVEQPTKFELSVNLKTADTLGLTIPRGVLGRADDVIE
jgi:putative ABC transport system substrate-binding protein